MKSRRYTNEQIESLISMAADILRASFEHDIDKKVTELKDKINGELEKVGKSFTQMLYMNRIHGMQLETIVRLTTEAIPEYREHFILELKRTMAMVGFLDMLNPPGEFSALPIRERVDKVREWNVEEGNLFIDGKRFGLPEHIINNPSDYTFEEIEVLAKEFHFDNAEWLEQERTSRSAKEPSLIILP